MVTLGAAVAITGCNTEGPSTIAVPPGEYPRAFDLTLEALRDAKFDVERVDAARGVIATLPKPTSGAATPWDLEQRSLGQEWQDLVNHQARIVRVWARPVGQGQAPEDFVTYPGAVELRVETVLLRSRRPGYRIETESQNLGGTSVDQLEARQGLYNPEPVPLRLDEPFQRELADRITRRLKSPA